MWRSTTWRISAVDTLTHFIYVVIAGTFLAGAVLGEALLSHIRAARRIESLRVELAAVQVRLESETLKETERVELLEQSELRLRAAFDSLAGETLRTNSEVFLRLARVPGARPGDRPRRAQGARSCHRATGEPLRTALERTEAQVQSLERERRDAFASLRTQIESLAGSQAQLQRETRNLVTALRRPEVRGRWGELTLRRLVELAGLSAHCDFTEQVHLVGEEGSTLRPDLVVHMPDARDLVIDAKTPLDAYLAALEAPTEEERQQALRKHAQQVETRVRELASKSYWSQFERSPEFAVLFLPGDQFRPPLSPSGRSCWRTPSPRASSSRHPQPSWRC